MSKIRINDLARELEVKSKAILDVLPEVGVTEKKTHSSSLEDFEAEKVRAHFKSAEAASSRGARSSGRESDEIKPKIDLSHISKPGDVLRLIAQKQQAAAAPPPPAPRPTAVPPKPPAPVEAKPAAAAPTATPAPPAPPKPAAPPEPQAPAPPAPRFITPQTVRPPAPIIRPPAPPTPPPAPTSTTPPTSPTATPTAPPPTTPGAPAAPPR